MCRARKVLATAHDRGTGAGEAKLRGLLDASNHYGRTPVWSPRSAGWAASSGVQSPDLTWKADRVTKAHTEDAIRVTRPTSLTGFDSEPFAFENYEHSPVADPLGRRWPSPPRYAAILRRRRQPQSRRRRTSPASAADQPRRQPPHPQAPPTSSPHPVCPALRA